MRPPPKNAGGSLIRKFARAFSEAGLARGSPLWVACSGGADSTALAALLARYGGNFVAREGLGLLHVHHGWRGKASEGDALFVEDLAKRLRVGHRIVRVEPPGAETGSWEADAREKRRRAFMEVLGDSPAQAAILTAHTQEDLAETALWRICTGTFAWEGAGILGWDPAHRLLRPFLRATKPELLAFLAEEGLSHREDATNADPRFLRARMRGEIFPALTDVFPRAIERIAELALALQREGLQREGAPDSEVVGEALRGLFRANRIPLRSGNHRELEKILNASDGEARELSLPGGWRVKLTRKEPKENR